MVAGRKEAGDRNVLPSRHSPFPSMVLSPRTFCFERSALRMFSFPCTCRCDSLPSDVPFFIWENPRCVLRDGHTRSRNDQHVQTPAFSLQTEPGFALPPDGRDQRSQGRPGAACGGSGGPGPEPEPERRERRAGTGTCRDRSALSLLGTAAPAGSTAALLERLCAASLLWGGGMNRTEPPMVQLAETA